MQMSVGRGSRFCLAPLAVGYIALSNILHYVLNWLLDCAFTYRLASYQDMHECCLMIYIIPVAELHPVQVSGECREDGAGNGWFVKPRDVFGEQFDEWRKFLGHRRWRVYCTSTGFDSVVFFQCS